MKTRIVKASIAVALGIGVGLAFLDWYPFPFALAWPGLVLARVGVAHSWLIAVLMMVALLVWVGVRSRGRAWWQVVAVSLLVSSGYCAAGFLYVARVPVPLPTVTPYESRADQRAAYLSSFDSGFRDGMVGIMRTYCFCPEAETRGFYEGAYEGSKLWYRLLGRRMTDEDRTFMEVSAARDGVRVELTEGNGQPDSAANGSEPIRSETNSTSSAAGSRR